MKNLTLITATILSAILMTSCSSSRHMTDYDFSVDFSTYKTYVLISHFDEGQAPRSLTERRIEKAIIAEMGSRNYLEISEKPDFFINYTLDADTSTAYYGSSNGMGYGRRWRGGYSTTYSEVETKYGIININVVDAKTNNVVWTTSIRRTIPTKNQEEKLNKEIVKAFKEYPVQNAKSSEQVISD